MWGAGYFKETDPERRPFNKQIKRRLTDLWVDLSAKVEDIVSPIQTELAKDTNKFKFYHNSALGEGDIQQFYTQLPEGLPGAKNVQGLGWHMRRPWLDNSKIAERYGDDFDLKFAIASSENFHIQGFDGIPSGSFYQIKEYLKADESGSVWPILPFTENPYEVLQKLVKQAKREIILESSKQNSQTRFGHQAVSRKIFEPQQSLALQSLLKVEVNAIIKQYIKQRHEAEEKEDASLRERAGKQSCWRCCFP
jgi:hypothetical protein